MAALKVWAASKGQAELVAKAEDNPDPDLTGGPKKDKELRVEIKVEEALLVAANATRECKDLQVILV